MLEAQSLKQHSSPPRHVAIIMDGNGRWARARMMPRIFGHRRGVEVVRDIVKAAGELHIQYLTLYAFSSENWRRPEEEVNDLMGLLRHYLRKEIAELHESNVRVRFIGDRTQLSPDLVLLIDAAETLTKSNNGLDLVVAVNYGAKDEILQATLQIAREIASGERSADNLKPEDLENHLQTKGIPDPDLVIRTSGEKRLSNFLLWQAAYSELLFVDTLWPDFTPADLEQAVTEFQSRERRFGAVG